MVLTLFHPLYNVKETVHFKEDLFSEFFVDALLCLNVEIYFCDNRISFRYVRFCIVIAFVTIRVPLLGFIVVR